MTIKVLFYVLVFNCSNIICFTNHCQDKKNNTKLLSKKLLAVVEESSDQLLLAANLKQEIGKRMPVQTKAEIRAAARERIAMLEQNPKPVIN